MVRSVQRGLDVLELVGGAARPLTLPEITAALDLPRTTAFSIVRTLCARGALEAAGTRGYRVGPLLPRLAQARAPVRDLADVMRRHLQELARLSGETVFLAVPAGDETVFVDKLESPQAIRFSAQVGSRRPLYCSAHGKAALAARRDAEIREYLARTPLVAYTARTQTYPDTIVAEVARTRRRGYAVSDAEFTEGAYTVAVPIAGGADGGVLCIVSVGGPAVRMKKRQRELAALLLRVAAEAAEDCSAGSVRLPVPGNGAAPD